MIAGVLRSFDLIGELMRCSGKSLKRFFQFFSGGGLYFMIESFPVSNSVLFLTLLCPYGPFY